MRGDCFREMRHHANRRAENNEVRSMDGGDWIYVNRVCKMTAKNFIKQLGLASPDRNECIRGLPSQGESNGSADEAGAKDCYAP